MSERNVILVVDDEALVRIVLVEMLADAGHGTLEASSAAEAIVILEEHPEIKVVFTDVQMPGTMDGVELARYVRRRWPPTIIVVSSGKMIPRQGDLPDDIAFLPKPFDRRKLGHILAGVASRLAEL